MFVNKKTTVKRGFYPALPFHPKGLSALSGRSPGSCSSHPLPSRNGLGLSQWLLRALPLTVAGPRRICTGFPY